MIFFESWHSPIISICLYLVLRTKPEDIVEKSKERLSTEEAFKIISAGIYYFKKFDRREAEARIDYWMNVRTRLVDVNKFPKRDKNGRNQTEQFFLLQQMD